MTMFDIKVIVVDDHDLVRKGLYTVLSLEEDISIIAEADSGKDAIELVKEMNPDVVLMDINLPDIDGIVVTKFLKASFPHTKVLALTMYSEVEYIKNFFSAGGTGYINKSFASEEVVQAIRTVASGKVYLKQEAMQVFIPENQEILNEFEEKDSPQLSSREKEIVYYLVRGFNCREIGEKLFLSTRTIETHRNRIMKKLELTHLSEIVEYAIQNDFLEGVNEKQKR